MTERQNHEERMENQEYSMSGRETRDQQAAATAAEQHILNEPHCGHCGGTGVAQEAAIPLPEPDGYCEPCQGTGERQEDIPVTTTDDQIHDPDTHLSYEVDPPEAVTRATGIILTFDPDGTYQRIPHAGPLGLERMQALVDGMIERVATPSFDCWVNEEGLMRDDFEPNIGASYLLGKHGAPGIIIVGPAFIAASDEDGNSVPAPNEVIDTCIAGLHQLGYTQVRAPALTPIAGGSGEDPVDTILARMQELLVAPERWTQRAPFRKEDGSPCLQHEAVRFCLSGALAASSDSTDAKRRVLTRLYAALEAQTGNNQLTVTAFNDTDDTRFADVRALLARARRLKPIAGGSGGHVMTPWGPAQTNVEIVPGVRHVTTASHGGLQIDDRRWMTLPAAARQAFTRLHPKGWAEEDCEMAIALVLLGLEHHSSFGGRDSKIRGAAIGTAQTFDDYRPCLEAILAAQPIDPRTGQRRSA